MVRIEIELIGENVKNEIYDLRNYLKEHIPDVDFAIKQQPGLPGQMGIPLEPIINGLLHAGTAILFEELYRNLLRPLFLEWLHLRKAAGSRLEVMSSVSTDDAKMHFLEDSDGNSQVFNYEYKIDTNKTFVLLIGVGKFTNEFHPIPPVQGNLEDLYKILTSKKHIGIPRENVLISFNESHVEIQKHLLQASRRQDIQTLIIYFAGHGHRTDIKKLSLIAADTEKMGDEIIGGIDFDFIANRIMKNSLATQKILVLDSCHSGIATQGTEDLLKNFDVKGSYILASSPADDVSYFERNARHTFFTGALLDVLENGIDNTNEMLALDDLRSYTTEVFLEKKFPHPDARSDLNIPPSDFFIARNPSFSSEKLKWRAYNLFRDGKLEDALDELRKLVKRFPEDENLRKQFEECETELSFSKLLNEANTLFYEKKDFKEAAIFYKKAYGLKKDAMVMEKIRQCEKQGITEPIDVLRPIKDNPNFQAYKKASERRAFYAAFQYLKKVRQSFPNSDYVKDEFLSFENKLKKMADGKNDERLAEYYRNLEAGDLQQAMTELKVQINNDPEYPVFLQLQRSLSRQIKERNNEAKDDKTPLFFRLFETFREPWKLFLLLGIVALVTIAIVMYIRSHSKKTFSEMKEMLKQEPEKAVPLLEEEAKKNDSAHLILGDYYRKIGSYSTAQSWYARSTLPAAYSGIGKMYYEKELSNFADTSHAKRYFEMALQQGSDTTASTYLGIMAIDSYIPPRKYDVFELWFGESDKNWKDAERNFVDGYKNGSVACKQQLGKMYFLQGKRLYEDSLYDYALGSFRNAIQYENSDAMVDLGYMFNDGAWKENNRDSAEKWYRIASQYDNPYGLNNYASMLIGKTYANRSYWDSAYEVLLRAKELNPSNGSVYYNLGVVFENGGIRVPKSLDSAKRYYHLAVDRANAKAKDALTRLGESY